MLKMLYICISSLSFFCLCLEATDHCLNLLPIINQPFTFSICHSIFEQKSLYFSLSCLLTLQNKKEKEGSPFFWALFSFSFCGETTMHKRIVSILIIITNSYHHVVQHVDFFFIVYRERACSSMIGHPEMTRPDSPGLVYLDYDSLN